MFNTARLIATQNHFYHINNDKNTFSDETKFYDDNKNKKAITITCHTFFFNIYQLIR